MSRADLTDNQRAWVDALRSGEYKQARNCLKMHISDTEYAHCCLGVLAELSGCVSDYAGSDNVIAMYAPQDTRHRVDSGNASTVPPDYSLHWLGVPEKINSTVNQIKNNRIVLDTHPVLNHLIDCAYLNDNGFTFNQIADMIEYFGLKKF